MPWGGSALLFVRKAADNEALTTGMGDVLRAVEDRQARLVILARDAEAGLSNQIRSACERMEVTLFEVPHGEELGNAALLGVSLSVCAVVAGDQDQDVLSIIQAWKIMLYTIWVLYHLLGYNP